MNERNPQVNEFFERVSSWKDEMLLLRNILLDCGLTEELKWKHPCYTVNGKNVVMIGGFKEYCALMLFKGSLLMDDAKLLVVPGSNSDATRQIRFANTESIRKLEKLIKQYMFEAMEVEKAGKKVKVKSVSEMSFPAELMEKFESDKLFKEAFESLTPGRQKGYLIHFNGAKQSATRRNRIEKYSERILKGKGIDDCICGLSKRIPRCDGSHKNIC